MHCFEKYTIILHAALLSWYFSFLSMKFARSIYSTEIFPALSSSTVLIRQRHPWYQNYSTALLYNTVVVFSRRIIPFAFYYMRGTWIGDHDYSTVTVTAVPIPKGANKRRESEQQQQQQQQQTSGMSFFGVCIDSNSFPSFPSISSSSFQSLSLHLFKSLTEFQWTSKQ